MPIWASVFGGLLGSTTSAASRRKSGYAATTRGSLVIGSLSLFATYRPLFRGWPIYIPPRYLLTSPLNGLIEEELGLLVCRSRHDSLPLFFHDPGGAVTEIREAPGISLIGAGSG